MTFVAGVEITAVYCPCRAWVARRVSHRALQSQLHVSERLAGKTAVTYRFQALRPQSPLARFVERGVHS